MSDREVLLLDAAIDVLADSGIRRLTHRAVDARAGVPLGSTSNRFRTRDALLAGVLHRLLDRESAVWTRISAGANIGSIDALAGELGRLVQVLAGAERAITVARYAVFAQAALQPTLRAELHSARRRLTEWLGPLLTDLGSQHPVGDVRHLLALVDGLLIGQLVDPAHDFAPAPAIAALLHGLIDCGPGRRPGGQGGGCRVSPA